MISGWMTLGKSAHFRVRASWHFYRPYLSHYKTAFAFCPFLYPLGNSASLAFRLLLKQQPTDPMGLTLFRRQPISEVFRWPGSLGALRRPRPLRTVRDVG